MKRRKELPVLQWPLTVSDQNISVLEKKNVYIYIHIYIYTYTYIQMKCSMTYATSSYLDGVCSLGKATLTLLAFL